jgi:hypothetical protein
MPQALSQDFIRSPSHKNSRVHFSAQDSTQSKLNAVFFVCIRYMLKNYMLKMALKAVTFK